MTRKRMINWDDPEEMKEYRRRYNRKNKERNAQRQRERMAAMTFEQRQARNIKARALLKANPKRVKAYRAANTRTVNDKEYQRDYFQRVTKPKRRLLADAKRLLKKRGGEYQ